MDFKAFPWGNGVPSLSPFVAIIALCGAFIIPGSTKF